jgi:hypothetical protein
MFILVLLLRLLWQLHPSLLTCALFWVFVAEYWYIVPTDCKINWWSRSLTLAGMFMNAVVTLANNGRMPYLGGGRPRSIWVAGTGKRLLFLCDRFDGFSIGDFFIIGGIAAAFLFWLYRIPAGNERTGMLLSGERTSKKIP